MISGNENIRIQLPDLRLWSQSDVQQFHSMNASAGVMPQQPFKNKKSTDAMPHTALTPRKTGIMKFSICSKCCVQPFNRTHVLTPTLEIIASYRRDRNWCIRNKVSTTSLVTVEMKPGSRTHHAGVVGSLLRLEEDCFGVLAKWAYLRTPRQLG